jgi:hypothetical protein
LEWDCCASRASGSATPPARASEPGPVQLVTEGSIAATVVPAQDMSVVGGRGAGGTACLASLSGRATRCGWWRHRDCKARSATASSDPSPPPWSGSTQTPTKQTVVCVQVPYEQAAELAARAATGKVAVLLDSRER